MRWLWGLVLLTPLAVGFSFPSVFVLGGISLAMLKSSFFHGENRDRIAFVAFNLTMITSFLILLMTFSNASYQVQYEIIMRDFWMNGYLPVSEPWRIPLWIVDVFSSHLLSYPLGGSNGASTFSLIAFLIGCGCFWKNGDKKFLVMLAGVIGLAFIASAMQRYPFGGHARLMQYFAPLACLLIGSGFAVMIHQLWPDRLQPSVIRISMGLLLAIGLTILIQDVRNPYKESYDQEHREFTEQLWKNNHADRPLYCLMDSEEFPTTWSKFYYRCQQQIVTGGKYQKFPPRNQLVHAQTYQAVVWYRDRSRKGVLSDWHTRLKKSFDVTDRKLYPIDFGEEKAWYEVLTLRPRRQNTKEIRTARRSPERTKQ